MSLLKNNEAFYQLLVNKSIHGPNYGEDEPGDRFLPVEALNEAISLIETGLVYEHDFEKYSICGPSVLGEMFKAISEPQQRVDLFRKMIERGLNSLRATDKELKVILSDTAMILAMDGHLAKLEECGEGLRTAGGGNLYHCLAAGDIRGFGDLLASDALAYPGRDGRDSWLNARDSAGNTPFHVLWHQDTLDHFIDQLSVMPRWWSVVHAHIYRCDISCLLIDRGANMFLVNNIGQTAWDLRQDNAELDGQMKNPSLRDKLRSKIEQKCLEQGTTGVLKTQKLGLRL